MQDIEWEDVVVNDNSLDDIEWEDAKPVTQSVMDDRDGKIYNVPLAMDGIDTRYAIDTQHKGADKGSFFGKLNLDVDNIVELKAKALDYIHEKTKSALRGVVGIAGDVADTIVTEVSGLRDAQYKAEKGYSRYPSFFFGSNENQEEVKAKAQETVTKLENIKKRNQEWWNNAKQAIKKEEEMDEVDKFVEALSGGAVSVAASATSTLALRSPKVAAGVMATLFGKMRENELIDEALEQGVDIEKAEMIGAGGGLIEAGLEFAGDLFISKFAKLKPIMDAKDRILSSAIVKAAKDKIGKAAVKKIATSHADSVIGAFAKGFGSEAFEEASQTGLGMGYENLVGLSNYSADEIYSNTLASAIIGGITGGTAGGIGTAYNNRIIRQTNERIKKLLKEDAPSLNDQELQVMADGVQEMLFQESTAYIDELNKVLDKEASPEVLKEGLTPEQLTAETRKLLKEKYKMTDEQIDQTIKSSLSVIDARSQFNEAYTIFNEGLSNAGRDAARADAEARILAVRALAVARAEGTQVKDVLDRWNLQFRQTSWNEADIDGDANFQFAGPGAKNAALDKLDMAKQFEAKGLDAEDIRKQTGWFKGPDNKWRFEISDKDAKVTLIDFYKNIFNRELEEQENILKRFPDYKPAADRLAELKSLANEVNDKNIYKLLQRDGHVYNFRLDQILQHDKLFEAYPEFRDVYVRFIVGDKNSGGYTETSSNSIGENWKASDTTININIASTRYKYPQLRKVLMHEIQHMIQTKEGFARGGSQSEYKTYLADIKSEYRQKIVKLFTDVVSEGLGVKVPYHQAIKLMEDVLEGNSENKGYIYKENNIERSDLKKLIDSRIEELVKKEGEIRDDMSKKIPRSEFEYYGRLFGEIEARNTARRINFSDKKRSETPAEETQDIKNADAIILFDDGTKVSYSNKNKMYYQEGVKQPSGHVVKPYTDRNNPSRLLHRQDENMLPEEKKAWDDYFAGRSDADRIKANLEKYKGTPWERLAREQVFVHQAVNMILDGKTPDFESALDVVSYGKNITSDINSIAAILRGRVLSGGSGLKTVHSVNSSFLNCNPTPGCAKYCYAASSLLARNKNWLKPVLIDVLAENKPDLLAEMIVDQFKVSPLGQAGNKAIRLFDEGDGAPHWMNVIKEINKLGYRVAIFTKRKEFAWEVINHDNKKYGEAFNLVMFSSDASNFSEVEGDKKIPVAFVYSDESEIPMIKKMADNGQVRVILPIKYKGGKGIANETLQALFEEVPEVKPHVCPIDAGFKKIDPRVYVNEGDVKLTDKTSKGWNCAFCDRKGGVGCYHGFSTEKMNKLISKAKELKKSEEADIISQFQNLFTIIETLKQGDFVNDRQYREAGFVVGQDQQGDDRVLQDVTTSETGRRGDLGWLVSILNKRLTDVSGAVRRVSEANMSDSGGGSVGSGYQTSNGNGGYDTGVRDDGRGRSGSSARQSGLDNAQFQDIKNPQGPRGAYQNSIIYLFENADASTIIHELGHFFLDDMQKFSDNETTKRQLEAIYKFVGSTDGKLTPEQHEYFANAFELYLMEGRAPNKVLEGVFIRFRKWLTRMWSEIKRIGNVQLTPEIRKVFDEMLGGRGLDFAMQMSGAKMAEALESGTIPANVIAKAVQLLEDGKMSRADMDDLIARMKSGELKRGDFNQELKKFENSNTKHNERLNPFDKVKYREALARGNFSKRDVLEKINRLLKWTEPRSQNGKVVGRFSNLKMNQEFDHIRELMNMEKVQAKEKLEENIKLINAMIRGEETGDMDRLVFDNKILTIRLNKANASLLLDVYNAISDSYNMGRLTTAVTGEARRARKNRLVNETVHVLTADGDVDWRRERGKLEQFVNQLGTSQMSWQGILDILSMNDKTSKTGRSLLVQNLDVFDAQQKEAQGLAEDGEKASRFMEKKLKGVGNAAISVSRYVNSKLDEKFTIQWGLNKKTFTKDQLLDIYMKAKDEETRKMMLEDPVLQYNERFLSEVNEILTAEDRAIAEALFEFYDDNYVKINAFYEEKYGTSLGKRAFYSPRTMDRGGINVDSGDLSSYAGFSGVKERKAKAGAVKIKGAFQVLQDYIVNSNHWIAWSDKLIDINAVMGDVEVKNIIRNLFGEGMEKRIAYEVSRMASNDKFQSKFGYGKLFNKIRSNYAIAALAAKPSLMIKQLTSFPAYWEHMSTAEFMSGLADFAVHMKEAVETLGNTTLMKTRDVNIIKDFEELSRSELFKKNANKVKLRELLMANIKLGDRGAIYMGGWALYKAELKKNLAKGMSEEKAKALALDKFERVTDETQQSGRLSQQSYWQSNPFLRAFTMFQSSQNQYLRKEINAIRGLATGRMDKKQALKTLFIFHVLLPCFFQYASDGFDWDEKAQLRAALLGSLNGIFILNGILERGLDYALGTADAWKATSTALSDVLPFWGSGEDLAKFFIDLAEGDIDLEDYVEVVRAFGKPVGELTGIPVKYPLDVIQNFGSYAEDGEVKKKVLLWLGWSPYALRDKEED